MSLLLGLIGYKLQGTSASLSVLGFRFGRLKDGPVPATGGVEAAAGRAEEAPSDGPAGVSAAGGTAVSEQ